LLRPKSFAISICRGTGCTYLPLESTVTPMENEDYLAAWADHDETRRELCRHSLRDAEAYDEYGRPDALHGPGGQPILKHGAARPHVVCSWRFGGSL